MVRTLCLVMIVLIGSSSVFSQQPENKRMPAKKARAKKTLTKKTPKPFRWVNPMPKGDWPVGLEHGTFESPSMKVDVGYCIYLPPSYKSNEKANHRFPVVYYLHGGRPGSETKSIRLTKNIDDAMRNRDVPEMIYVFVNGGRVSHYNTPQFDSLGEDVFIKELIPHIDATYRTISNREHRGLEGFSQGGRGTTRIMFRHPDKFSSCAPGGAGQATEKSISENNGRENEHLVFAEGDNTWDLARQYAKSGQPPLRILVHVGTDGFNYENNLEYMDFLTSLEISFTRLIVEGVPHSATRIYEKRGLDLMRFHAANFDLTGPTEK